MFAILENFDLTDEIRDEIDFWGVVFELKNSKEDERGRRRKERAGIKRERERGVLCFILNLGF